VLDKVAEQWGAIDLDPCHDRNPCHDRDPACLVRADLVYDIREGQDGLVAIDPSATSSASCARGPQSGSSSDYWPANNSRRWHDRLTRRDPVRQL